MKKNEGATITIRPKKLRAKLDAWQYRDVHEAADILFEKIARKTIRIMREEAPVKTGKLKASISIKKKDKASGGRDRRFSASVGPSVRYANYVSRGTGPSPGRFVYAIKKRVRDGIHPGTPVNNFISRTRDRVDRETDSSNFKWSVRKAFNRRLKH